MEFSDSFARLIAAFEALERGEIDLHSLDDLTTQPDPLGSLVRVFQRMATVVLAREEDLKQRLFDLAIQIDEAKALQDAERIIGSERFQRIQQVAKRRPPTPKSQPE